MQSRIAFINETSQFRGILDGPWEEKPGRPRKLASEKRQ
jgi:hypothetical protein